MSEKAQSSTSALHVSLEGRVQGVGFRMFVHRAASDLDLKGWVRNRFDGSVEVWAEGSHQNLERLLSKLQNGPPSALVTSLNSRWETPTGGYRQFSVRSTT